MELGLRIYGQGLHVRPQHMGATMGNTVYCSPREGEDTRPKGYGPESQPKLAVSYCDTFASRNRLNAAFYANNCARRAL